jgi:HSP20 family protein
MARLRQLGIRYLRFAEAGMEIPAGPWLRVPSVARPEWRPACDVLETGSEWIVKAELAGLDEQDFEVMLYQDGLVVEGRRPWVSPAGNDDVRVHAAEIRHGPFRLAVRLPDAVDRDAAGASYERGLLVVRLPKASAGVAG